MKINISKIFQNNYENYDDNLKTLLSEISVLNSKKYSSIIVHLRYIQKKHIIYLIK